MIPYPKQSEQATDETFLTRMKGSKEYLHFHNDRASKYLSKECYEMSTEENLESGIEIPLIGLSSLAASF